MSSVKSVLDMHEEIREDGHEGVEAALLTLAAAVLSHADATRAIAHGGTSGATGLEGLAMALAGEGLRTPVSEALSNISMALEDIGNNLRTDD